MATQEEQKEAIEGCEKIIALHPDEPEGYYKKVKLLSNLARYNEALVEYDGMILRFPKDIQIYIEKALVFIRLGALDKAIEEYRKAIDIDPTDAKLFLHMSECFLWLNKMEPAHLLFKKALEIEKSNSKKEESIFHDINSDNEETSVYLNEDDPILGGTDSVESETSQEQNYTEATPDSGGFQDEIDEITGAKYYSLEVMGARNEA